MLGALLTNILNPAPVAPIDVPDLDKDKADNTAVFVAVGALIVVAALFAFIVTKK